MMGMGENLLGAERVPVLLSDAYLVAVDDYQRI